MMKFFKLLLLALFLIIGFSAANQLEANTAGSENSNAPRAARASPCVRPRPTSRPTTAPTTRPTIPPTTRPTPAPTTRPTFPPTSTPTTRPTPTTAPTTRPTSSPTQPPTPSPTTRPTPSPTQPPTPFPTTRPTPSPTQPPTPAPTTRPTAPPTQPPTTPAPTQPPTPSPTQPPTPSPTQPPTPSPTQPPTPSPTQPPTPRPTSPPTPAPTQPPTPAPTPRPTTPPPTPAPTTRPTTPPSVGLCDVVPLAQEPLKFLVPLYVYPTSGKWDIVADGASKVDTIGIVNPNNGPTAQPSGSYSAGVNKLHNAKVELVGYVYTSYADRPIADAKKDIDTWASNWPHINGIFFDEASSKAADVPYYRELYNHVVSKGFKHSILNPGTQPDQGYLAISTNIVIFESYGDRYGQKNYASWVKCAPNAAEKAGYKYKFSGIAHSVSGNSASTALIRNMANSGIGMVYITDGTPDTSVYNPFPSYYTSQVADIQAMNH